MSSSTVGCSAGIAGGGRRADLVSSRSVTQVGQMPPSGSLAPFRRQVPSSTIRTPGPLGCHSRAA